MHETLFANHEDMSDIHPENPEVILPDSIETGEPTAEAREIMERYGDERVNLAGRIFTRLRETATGAQAVGDQALASLSPTAAARARDLPFIGSALSVAEAAIGREAAGDELSTAQRRRRGIAGAIMFGVELVPLTKGARVVGMSIPAARAFATRMLESGSTKGARVAEAGLSFLESHPAIVADIEQRAENYLHQSKTV